MNLENLLSQNKKALRKKQNLEKILSAKEIHDLSKIYSYKGFVEVTVGECTFVMFSNNDDAVAKHYFWNGANAYEDASLRIWEQLSKSCSFVLDIGAYTGVYSLVSAAANPATHVHAFEPLDRVYSRVLINQVANVFSRINVFPQAVSDSNGKVELNIFSGDSVLVSASSLLEKQSVGREVYGKKTIETVTLDSHLKNNDINVGLIKIDAENAEHLVIKGAMETLKKYTPDIFIEILNNDHNDEITKNLKSIGYTFYHIDDKNKILYNTSNIESSDNMYNLNTLCTLKTKDQLQEILQETGVEIH